MRSGSRRRNGPDASAQAGGGARPESRRTVPHGQVRGCAAGLAAVRGSRQQLLAGGVAASGRACSAVRRAPAYQGKCRCIACDFIVVPAATAARGDDQRRRHGQRRRGPCAVFHAYLHWAGHASARPRIRPGLSRRLCLLVPPGKRTRVDLPCSLPNRNPNMMRFLAGQTYSRDSSPAY